MACGKHHNALQHEAFVRFIRRAFPQATAAHLASITGQTVSAAEKQVSGQVRPSAEVIASCLAFFGPAFAASCIAGCGHWATPLGAAMEITELARRIGGIADGETLRRKAG